MTSALDWGTLDAPDASLVGDGRLAGVTFDVAGNARFWKKPAMLRCLGPGFEA